MDKVDREHLYSPREAIELLKEISYTTFDASVDLHFRLGVDPRHADQQVRDVVRLPHGLGKEVRVVVFAIGEAARIAEEAGADHVIYDDEGLQRIQEGWTDFDVAIAIPQMMSKVGRLGRILGPRGLMPNPKAGTVVPEDNLADIIEETKAGRVEFRVDKTSNLHIPIGKISFSVDKLMDNMTAAMEAVKGARPPAAKGSYVRKLTIASTMSPGIKIEPSAAMAMESKL
jgi:large subunit ribosomal protein L1